MRDIGVEVVGGVSIGEGDVVGGVIVGEEIKKDGGGRGGGSSAGGRGGGRTMCRLAELHNDGLQSCEFAHKELFPLHSSAISFLCLSTRAITSISNVKGSRTYIKLILISNYTYNCAVKSLPVSLSSSSSVEDLGM